MIRGLPKQIFLRLLGGLQDSRLELVCPDDTYTFGPANAPLRATAVIHDERFFKRALFDGDTGMGESFMDGDWSSPDLVALVQVAVRNLQIIGSGKSKFAAVSTFLDKLKHGLQENSVNGSRKNIRRHYDLGNDFYKLFLDPTMAYSCAYYQTPADSLEDAQLQKYDRICKKLRLRATDHVLEIGTGWGGFALFAAKEYGCRVTTTTISKRQFEYAQALFQQSGEPGERITLLLEDYRKLDGKFDKLVSIEMFEAVGLKYYDTFFSACDRLLKPDGQMFLQAITMQEQNFAGYRRRSDWIQKYIFPGAELASIAEILRSLGRCTKLSLQSAQDIGQHYAETLKNWRETFLGRVEQVKVLGFDEKFVRMWEYYLAYCEGAFREGYVGEIQLVLHKDQARTQFPVAAVESEQRIELLPASRAGGRQALRITRDKPVFRT